MTRRICVLVFPDFQLLDAAGPIAAFESAGAYKVRTVPSGLLGAQFLGRSLWSRKDCRAAYWATRCW